jgi:hypothetical protein
MDTITNMHEIFEQEKYSIRQYHRLTREDYSAYLIFERDMLEIALENDSENNAPVALLEVIFFADHPQHMRIETFNKGQYITELELRDKMEGLARHLRMSTISIADCSQMIVIDSKGRIKRLRLDVLDTLCDGKSAWNKWGYKRTPDSKQDLMDSYNEIVTKATVAKLMTQFYYHVNFKTMYPIESRNKRVSPKLSIADLSNPYLRKYWDAPVCEFFTEVRKKILQKEEELEPDLSMDFILRLLHDIAEYQAIMVTGEFEYITKVL